MATWPVLAMHAIELRRADAYGPLQGDEIVPVYSPLGHGRSREGSVPLSQLGGGGISGEFDTVAEMLASTVGSHGTGTVWRADGFRYREADPGATNHHLTTAGGVKLYVQPGDDGWYNFLAMNPARDGVTNDADKLNTLLAIRPTGGVGEGHAFAWPQGPSIFIPVGFYYMDAGPWGFQIKATTRIMGEGTGYTNNFVSTVLQFPVDVVGFQINHFDTIRNEIESVQTGGAAGTIIERLVLRGTLGGTKNPNAHGIWLRTQAEIRDVTIFFFNGHGVAIVGNAVGIDPLTHGGPNAFHLFSITSAGNGLSGVFVDGGDSNAASGHNLNTYSNGRWGIYDSSFLGVIWTGCHSRTNGLATSAGNLGGVAAGTSSVVCIDAGNGTFPRYYANLTATLQQLVETEPGHDDNIWVPSVIGGLTPHANYPVWQAGRPIGTYYHGGSYASDNINAPSIFIGCYSEGDQAPGHNSVRSMSLMGLSGWRSGAAITAVGGVVTTLDKGGWKAYDKYNNSIMMAGDNLASPSRFTALTFQGSSDGLPWRLQHVQSTGEWFLEYGGSARAFNITSSGTVNKMGTTRPIPYTFHAPTLALGGSTGVATTTRRQTTGTVIPTTGEAAQGDIVWSTTAVKGGKSGWTCTTGGMLAPVWVSGTNYAAGSNIKTSAGVFYTCSGDGLAGDEPSHDVGAFTGTDGYRWDFVAGQWTSGKNYAVGAGIQANTGLLYICRGAGPGASVGQPGWSMTKTELDGYSWTHIGDITIWATSTTYRLDDWVQGSNHRLYACSGAGPGASTVEPTHSIGLATLADGYKWTAWLALLSGWVSGATYNVGSEVRLTATLVMYRCTVKGPSTSTSAPTHASGTASYPDGYSWLKVDINIPKWRSGVIYTPSANPFVQAPNNMYYWVVSGPATGSTIAPSHDRSIPTNPLDGYAWQNVTSLTNGVPAPDWTEAANYAVGNCVRSSLGKFYRCTVDPVLAGLSTFEPTHDKAVTYPDLYQWTHTIPTPPPVAPVWINGTIYHTNQFVNANARYYKCTGAPVGSPSVYIPTHSTGAVTMADSYEWTVTRYTIPDWVSGTNYAFFTSYVLASNGLVYQCTVDGGRSLNEPTHASGAVVTADLYEWTRVPAWVTGTTYIVNNYIRASNTKFYRCTTKGAGASTIEPTHASGVVALGDGYSWLWVSNAPAAWVSGTNYALLALITASGGGFYSVTVDGGQSLNEPTHSMFSTQDDGYQWRHITNTEAVWSAFGLIDLEGTATYDPPSLAPGTVDTVQTVTVTGAALGDMVDASFSVSQQGVNLEAWVSAANTVSYRFRNPTGSATVDLGSGTVKCRVRK